jgi:hypothetical protein
MVYTDLFPEPSNELPTLVVAQKLANIFDRPREHGRGVEAPLQSPDRGRCVRASLVRHRLVLLLTSCLGLGAARATRVLFCVRHGWYNTFHGGGQRGEECWRGPS